MEANDWAEIHNYGASSIDISLWKLKDETLVNTYIIPSGTTLNADEYLVLVQDVDTFLMIHSDVTNYTGPFDFGFANGGGSIILQDALGATIREVDYLDTIPWPKGADGLGPSMEIINETAEENDPSNWFAGCVAGSPGEAYSPCNYVPVVSEINYNSLPAYNPGDWIEIWNNGATTLDLSGWVFRDADNGNMYALPNETILNADERLVFSDSLTSFTEKFSSVENVIGEFDFNLSNGGDAVRLYDNTGMQKYSVRFNDLLPWPTDADGDGFTLELMEPEGNPNDATAWVAGCIYGSPGKPFILPCSDAIESLDDPLFIIYPNPFNENVFITLRNSVFLENLFISDLQGRKIVALNASGDITWWDGKDDSNKKVAPGVYFIYASDKTGKLFSAQIIKQ